MEKKPLKNDTWKIKWLKKEGGGVGWGGGELVEEIIEYLLPMSLCSHKILLLMQIYICTLIWYYNRKLYNHCVHEDSLFVFSSINLWY